MSASTQIRAQAERSEHLSAEFQSVACEQTSTFDLDYVEMLNALKNEKVLIAGWSQETLLKTATEHHNMLCHVAKALLSSSRNSLISALRVGYILQVLQRKQKDEGSWVNFMRTNLPAMSKSTIYRYLRVAERFHDPTKIPKGLGIMEAFRAAGAVPERNVTAAGETLKNSEDATSAGKPFRVIAAIELSIVKLSASLNATGLDTTGRKAMGKKVQRLAEQLRKLANQLSSGRGAGHATENANARKN